MDYIHITAYDVNGNVIASKSIEDAQVNTHYPLENIEGASTVVIVVRKLN